jgi:NAD(P)H-dependent flavin oxidoreductase YrpB (nitropropane dioxygenase family)
MPYSTRLTEILNIDLPIMSAGMAGVAGPDLVAAVSNAGGIGTLGAIGMDPATLRQCIQDTRSKLKPGKPMGVDLLLPKLGEGARATNKDYTGGQLEGLINVMVEEKVELFVCAVGVPPKWVVEKLHAVGTVVMNMVGSPRHVKYCIQSGVDIICAQGGEAGGHTGSISTLVLVPQVVDLCEGTDIIVVGAGGIYNGRGIAATLALGAEGVWLGSRFIMTHEANVQPSYQKAILGSRSEDTRRTEIFTGRPARTLNNAYIMEWETARYSEKISLLKQGVIPWFHDVKSGRIGPEVPSPIPSGYRDYRAPENDKLVVGMSIVPVGQACGALNQIQSAADVVNELMAELSNTLNRLKG